MKEFKKSNTVTYNLMSFTGFKSLMIFTLLLESPKSYREICEFFKKHEYINEEISVDTFRVYITSLKRAGCEIVRESSDDGSKYRIVSHPFELKISEEQIKSIVKIYRIILKTIDVKGLYAFEKFIRELAHKTKNSELLDAINKVSVFKGINQTLLEDLISYALGKKCITFLYNSPRGKTSSIELVIDKIGISNGKVYLYGTNLKYLQYSYFLISRILEIQNVKAEHIELPDVKTYKVKYILKSLSPEFKLSDEEKILEINDDSITVEMESSNKFILKQKVMEYGRHCTVLEPLEFREEIINTLKRMREEYLNGKNK